MRAPKIAVLLAFVVFLALPLVQFLTGWVRVEKVNEHREKLAWPAGGLLRGPLRDPRYTTEVEAYFSDHFPLRDALLRIHGQLEYSLFGVAREVIVGRDGWLTDKKILAEHLPQLDQADPDQIRSGILQLKRLQTWLDGRGIRFLMVIVPVKPTIYADKFPDKYRRRTAQLGIEKFQKALALNGIPYVDLLSLFRKERDRVDLYYKTDLHWNTAGTALAAEAIVNRLSMDMYGRKLWSEDLVKSSAEFTGDELKAIPQLFTRPEVTPVWSSRFPAFVKLPPSEPDLEVYRGTDPKRAVLPPAIMFGNSFMLPYPDVGYHNYFVESSRVLDYQQFSRVMDWIQPQHRIVILQIYETQLQYHIMPTGRNMAWSGAAGYWDKRVAALPLPVGFKYRGPEP